MLNLSRMDTILETISLITPLSDFSAARQPEELQEFFKDYYDLQNWSLDMPIFKVSYCINRDKVYQVIGTGVFEEIIFTVTDEHSLWWDDLTPAEIAFAFLTNAALDLQKEIQTWRS